MSRARRAADWLHEASVLTTVFPLLDKLLTHELTTGWALGSMLIAGGLYVGSMLLDGRASRAP